MEKKGFLSRIGDIARASPGELAVLTILGAAVVGGCTFVYLRTSQPPAPAVRTTRAPIPGPSSSGLLIVVHVAGMVASPGVYELPQGSRVKDAVAAAGGPLAGADLHALNLAALVIDGERIFISKPGQPSPADARSPPGAAAGDPEAAPPGKLNLNTASAAQLEELPGVGPVLAQRILDFRRKKGRFASIRQLREVEGFGPKKYEAIKDLVTVQ